MSIAEQRRTTPLRRYIFLFGASLVGLAILGIATVLVELFYRPSYDRAHPDYDHYAQVFERLREPVSVRGLAGEHAIDLSDLNRGEWKVACLFGGYTDPLETMRALGANIDEKDRLRWTAAGSRGFRLAQVEEKEMAIAFADLGNTARFIHFKSGIGSAGQNFQKCIERPETRLLLCDAVAFVCHVDAAAVQRRTQ